MQIFTLEWEARGGRDAPPQPSQSTAATAADQPSSSSQPVPRLQLDVEMDVQAELPATVSLRKGAVICRYEWEPESGILETVRATASFHGASYYDTVAVERERCPNWLACKQSVVVVQVTKFFALILGTIAYSACIYAGGILSAP